MDESEKKESSKSKASSPVLSEESEKKESSKSNASSPILLNESEKKESSKSKASSPILSEESEKKESSKSKASSPVLSEKSEKKESSKASSIALSEESEKKESSKASSSALSEKSEKKESSKTSSIALSKNSSINDIIESSHELPDALAKSSDKKESSKHVSDKKSSSEHSPRATMFDIEASSSAESNKKGIPPENDVEARDTLKKSVDGLKLSNPYYFQALLEKKDPGIFLSLRDGKFDGYSRMCPSTTRRQPVILTNKEVEELSKEKNNGLMGDFKDGEYNGPDLIKYGSNNTTNHYYMCPKYWCLLTNKPLTQKQIDDGECGGKDALIPKNAKVVPRGKTIYEFYSDTKTRYPGFHKEATPSGLCIPCCFESWNKPAQKERRKHCQMDKSEPVVRKEEVQKDQYIKGPEKVPLPEGRWGFLPIQIEKFFQEVNVNCKTTKFTISPNTTCILRLGGENNETQSFIACIATILFYGVSDPTTSKPKIQTYFPATKKGIYVPSIEQMKQIMVKSLKLDKFITYQNGDLVNVFYKNGSNNINNININLENYPSSAIINAAKTDQEKEFVNKCINSFESFKQFILDKEVLLDYTYLWDMLCDPNEYLFSEGINLIILEIMNNDNTNNVELICPTNHYSTHLFNPQKRSAVIIKQGNYYEPVLSYKNEEKSIRVVQTFQQNDQDLPESLKSMFTNILNPVINMKCKAFPSMPKEYKFKEAIQMQDLLKTLKHKKLTITSQILNFQGKVIGLKVENKEKGRIGVIPSFPSSLLQGISIEYMDEVKWFDYKTTYKMLKSFFKNDKQNILQVLEENVVVGFLTPTNQFIQIDPPLPENQAIDSISKVNENNYLVADIKTQLSNEKDVERIDFIKRITLENKFFNSFRNTIKIELNNYENIQIRNEIEKLCNNTITLYNTKLNIITDLLKKLLHNKITFVNKDDGFKIDEVNEIYTCVILPQDKCNESAPVCMFKDGTCNLLIPASNLVTNTNNEEFYFGKIADELIRFNRIKSFILNPQTFISFGKQEYNLKESEILILQSLITQSYFENKIPIEMNTFATSNSYDTAYPQQSIPLDNLVNFDEPNVVLKEDNIVVEKQAFVEGRILEEFEKKCKTKKTRIISKKLKECFPASFDELNYENSLTCSFKFIKDILYEIHNKNVSILQIKQDLIHVYKHLITDNIGEIKNIESQILHILLSEGKQIRTNDRSEIIQLEEYILQEDYWISNLDLWLLLIYYKINSMFISPFALRENNKELGEVLVYNSSKNDYLVMIILPSQKKIEIPNYKVVINGNNKVKLSLNEIVLTCFKPLESIKNYSKVLNYIQNFKFKKVIEFEIELEPVKKVKKSKTILEIEE